MDALLHQQEHQLQQAQLVQLQVEVESKDDNVEGAFETRGAYQEVGEEGASGRAGEVGAPPAKLARVV